MKIDVTSELIEKGIKCCDNSCPVALAITEAVGRGVYVEYDSITMYRLDGLPVSCRTPKRVFRFVRDFDNGRSVEPFSFKLPRRLQKALR